MDMEEGAQKGERDKTVERRVERSDVVDEETFWSKNLAGHNSEMWGMLLFPIVMVGPDFTYIWSKIWK